MGAVADIFDRDNDGYIDYQEFMTALRPDRVRAGSGRRNSRVGTDEEKIMTELKRQISHCTCCKQFMVIQVGDGKYRVCCLQISPFSLTELPVLLEVLPAFFRPYACIPKNH